MSLFAMPKLQRLASNLRTARARLFGRRCRNLVAARYRSLQLDPLEARRLLSVSPTDMFDVLVSTPPAGAQTTITAQSVATDHDGDFVVVWTRSDEVPLDPLNNPYIDPETGFALTDTNIYAKYLTDEVQRITLPEEVLIDSDNDPTTVARVALTYGGNEVQKVNFSTTYPADFMLSGWFSEGTLFGDYALSFDLDGSGTIDVGETTALIAFSEFGDAADNALAMQDALQALSLAPGDALSNVTVTALNPYDYSVEFVGQEGIDQPDLIPDPAAMMEATGLTAAGFAYLPAVFVTTTRVPVEIPNIPVYTNNAKATADRITEAFEFYTFDSFDVPPPAGNAVMPEVTRSILPRVSVASVRTADDPDGLRTFDITFTSDSGKSTTTGNLGKLDHPELLVAAVDDAADPLVLPIDVVQTMKQSSPEFRVNPEEPDDPFTILPDVYDQSNPAVAMDADGDFIITWQSEVPNSENFGSVTDIFARRFSPVGVVDEAEVAFWTDTDLDGTADPIQSVKPLEAPDDDNLERSDPGNFTFRVNTMTANAQTTPHVAMDDDGDFIVTWASTGQPISFFNGILARRFDRDGAPIGIEWLVNVEDTEIHVDPFVALSHDGHFMITWVLDPLPGRGAIQGEIYNPQGLVLIEQFTATTGASGPTAAFDMANNFLMGWDQGRDTDNIGITSLGSYSRMHQLYIDEIQELTITPDVPGADIEGYFQLDVGGEVSSSILFQAIDPAAAVGEIQKAMTGLGFTEVQVEVSPSTPDDFAYQITFRGDRPGANQPEMVFVNGSLAATATVTTTQDAGIGDTATPIRNEFRANSATLNAGNPEPAAWPLLQFGNQVSVDADGDVTISYEGFAPDISENVMLFGTYFDELINADKNADLLPYFDGFLPADVLGFPGSNWSVTGVIEEILIDAGPATTGTPLDATITVTGLPDFQTLTIDGGGVDPLTGEFQLEMPTGFFTPPLQTAPIQFDSANAFGTAANIQAAVAALSADYVGVTVAVASGVDPYAFDIDFAFAVAPPVNLFQVSTPGINEEQLGRLRAILDSVAGQMRGEAYGIMYSQFDAEPTYGPENIVASDVVVNSFRDGTNERYLIAFDSEVDGGTIGINVAHMYVPGSEQVSAAIVSNNGVLNRFDTGESIKSALQGAVRTGVNWPPPLNEGPVDVREVRLAELQAREGTDWDILALGIDPLEEVVYEVTFQGEVHDTMMTIWLGANGLTLPPVPEVQTLTASVATPGWFALKVGKEETEDILYDAANLGTTAAAIGNQLEDAGFDGVQVAYDAAGPPDTFVVTFAGDSAGEDHPAITLATANDHSAADGDVLLLGNIVSSETTKGDEPEPADPLFFEHTMADEGTVQTGASIGMEPDGDFVVAWTQETTLFGDNEIFYRRFEEDTDTAGPRVADLVAPDGTRTVDGGRFPTTDGLQHLVLTFDEEMLVVADVETQLAAMGIAPEDASDALISQLSRNYSDSVTNPNNYSLLRGTTLLGGVISEIQFGMNKAADLAVEYGLNPIPTNKWEAVITFDADAFTAELEPLPVGTYTIQVKHPIPASSTSQGQSGVRDKSRNPLNHTGFQPGGTDYARSFSVVIGIGPGAPGAPDEEAEDDPINVTQVGDQNDPAVAISADGTYMVVWVNVNPTIFEESEIIGQRFSSLGEAIGPEFIVNTYEVGPQIEPAIAMDDEGNFVVAWSGQGDIDDSGVFIRRFDQFARPLGAQLRVNQYRDSNQDAPGVAMDDTGNFVVTWTSFGQDGDLDGVFARRYNSFGVAQGDEFQVNTFTPHRQDESAAAMDADGDFVVIWESDSQDGNSLGVFGQLYDDTGTAVGDEFRVNSYTNDKQLAADVDMAPDGSFVATWASFLQDGSGYGVYARRYDAAGNSLGDGEFRVNETTELWQSDPVVGVSKAGDFSIAWTTFNQDDEDLRDDGIFARMYMADGTDFLDEDTLLPLGEFQVNATTQGDQVTPTIARDTISGDYAVVWVGPNSDDDFFYTDIFARLLDPPVERLVVNPEGVVQTALVLEGRPGDNVFEFNLGDSPNERTVTLNGTEYFVDPQIEMIEYHGWNAHDAVLLTGTDADDSLELWANDGIFRGSGFTVTISDVESVTVDALGGNDTATLYDSAGDDLFLNNPGSAVMVLLEGTHTANGFETVTAHSNVGGEDTAKLFDSTGRDTLIALPGYARLSGNGLTAVAGGFDQVHAFATRGGFNVAKMFDSAQDDTFRSSDLQGELFGPGYYNRAKGFTQVHAYASAGHDVATMNGSTGDDLFDANPTQAAFYGDGFYNRAKHFEEVIASGNAGGYDEARLHDSPGKDKLVATPIMAALYGDGFFNRVNQFDQVEAYATAGGYDVAKLFDSPDNDLFVSTPVFGALTGDDFNNRAERFEGVHAYATAGGYDVAKMFDSAGNDRFDGSPAQGVLQGQGFYNRAKQFESVHGYATAGGVDDAYLYDASTDDTYVGTGQFSSLAGDGFYNRVKYFENVHAHADRGGTDTAMLYDAALNDPGNASRLAWLYQFESAFTSTGSSNDEPVQQAIDEVLTAYWP